jgi:hypothetical protein
LGLWNDARREAGVQLQIREAQPPYDLPWKLPAWV